MREVQKHNSFNKNFSVNFSSWSTSWFRPADLFRLLISSNYSLHLSAGRPGILVILEQWCSNLWGIRAPSASIAANLLEIPYFLYWGTLFLVLLACLYYFFYQSVYIHLPPSGISFPLTLFLSSASFRLQDSNPCRNISTVKILQNYRNISLFYLLYLFSLLAT